MIRIGLVVSEFNREITAKMLDFAKSEALGRGAVVTQVAHVHGAFECAFGAAKLLARKDVDCAAVLAAVVKGQTKHDEVIVHAVAKQLLELSIKNSKPVGLGIIGPGASDKLAAQRAEEYARRAVRSAIELCEKFGK